MAYSIFDIKSWYCVMKYSKICCGRILYFIFPEYKCFKAAWARNIINGLSSSVSYTVLTLEYVKLLQIYHQTTWLCLKSGQTEYKIPPRTIYQKGLTNHPLKELISFWPHAIQIALSLWMFNYIHCPQERQLYFPIFTLFCEPKMVQIHMYAPDSSYISI